MKSPSLIQRLDLSFLVGGSVLAALLPLQAATVAIRDIAVARLDDTISNTPPTSTITDGEDVVSATVTTPTISLNGPSFSVAHGLGLVSAVRGGPPPGGGRNLRGTTAATIILVALQPGETLSYNIELAFEVIGEQGAGEPLLYWGFENITTREVYFAADIAAAPESGTRSETGVITATGAEILLFEVIAELNDEAIVPNSDASAGWTNLNFSGSIPEPSTFSLLLAACAPLLMRRR